MAWQVTGGSQVGYRQMAGNLQETLIQTEGKYDVNETMKCQIL